MFEKLSQKDIDLIHEMTLARKIVELAHSERKEKQIPVRVPLRLMYVYNEKFSEAVRDVILDEVNIKQIFYKKGNSVKVELDTTVTPELQEEADTRDLIRKIQAARKEIGTALNDNVKVVAPWIPTNEKMIELLKTKTLCITLEQGNFNVTKI